MKTEKDCLDYLKEIPETIEPTEMLVPQLSFRENYIGLENDIETSWIEIRNKVRKILR